MNSDVLVSVIVPVYNVVEYLDRCINSILSQTYTNLQVIVVDDGSSDGSSEKCDVWKEKDARVVVLHKNNEGVAVARNCGLKMAKGEFITFVDADDYIKPEMYMTMLSWIKSNSCDAAFAGYSIIQDEKQKTIENSEYKVVSREEAMIATLVPNGYFVSIWNKMFSRKVCFTDNEKAIEFDDYAWGEDEVWLFKVLQNCNRVFLGGKALYNWTVREGSASRNDTFTNDKMKLLEVEEFVYHVAQQTGKKVELIAGANQFINIYNLLISAYVAGDREAQKILFLNIKKYYIIWLKSDGSFLGKIKKVLVLLLIRFHVHKTVLEKIVAIRK